MNLDLGVISVQTTFKTKTLAEITQGNAGNKIEMSQGNPDAYS